MHDDRGVDTDVAQDEARTLNVSAKKPGEVTLCAVGDIGLIGKVSENITRFGAEHPFLHVAHVLRNADITFGNLEMPFCEEESVSVPTHQSPKFRADSSAVKGLIYAGFDVLSLANNHILECGPTGLEYTQAILEENRIKGVGAGLNLAEARKPVVIDCNGIQFGFLAYCTSGHHTATSKRPGAAPIDMSIIEEDITLLEDRVDSVIVSLHFGLMYMEYPSEPDQAITRRIVDLGAKLILGHHPHVLQGFEQYGNGLIAYSFGEFIFDRTAGVIYSKLGRDKRRESLILRCNISKNGIANFETLPVYFNDDFQPEILQGETAKRILSRIEELSHPLQNDAVDTINFYQYAGQRLVEYELGGLLVHLQNLHLRFILSKLLRVRWRHRKLLVGFTRAKVKRLLRSGS